MKQQVIAILDVGRADKKLFLFDRHYNIVHEQSTRFTDIVDEDGFPCEDIGQLRLWVFDALRDVLHGDEFEVKALNFSTYGASMVYVDEAGKALTPLYSYLKPYPKVLEEQFYRAYCNQRLFSAKTASPALGSLNSGLQLYRLKHHQPEVFARTRYALHLPQYLSFLVTSQAFSDITSVGCHTALWDFQKNLYHRWVTREHVHSRLAPIRRADEVLPPAFPAGTYAVGIGLHDSSASLIPYLVNFHEPFALISTNDWCITLNPFNETPLTQEELLADCLCYLNYKGAPVKASRLFTGPMMEEQLKKIAEIFHCNTPLLRTMYYNPATVARLQKLQPEERKRSTKRSALKPRDWSVYQDAEEAYHQLMMDIVSLQQRSTQLVLDGSPVRRIFVDGAFSRNSIYMNLLASAFPELEVFAASMPQATALGAALAIHHSWNKERIPNDLIALKYYSAAPELVV